MVLHFECRYRALTVVSTRNSLTLGGNRTIAEPFELEYGFVPPEVWGGLILSPET